MTGTSCALFRNTADAAFSSKRLTLSTELIPNAPQRAKTFLGAVASAETGCVVTGAGVVWD